MKSLGDRYIALITQTCSLVQMIGGRAPDFLGPDGQQHIYDARWRQRIDNRIDDGGGHSNISRFTSPFGAAATKATPEPSSRFRPAHRGSSRSGKGLHER